ncbi:MAG: aminomethyl-transferring glycine dehydrogenase [Flavobacteriales bacterium]|nr:aminomethyl-transferring glycine dehydrogenase [Flavobacteriales bacterium]MCB9449141.1 aminomethyl-transferring glycine dehydrogenase [Flavobacteriales bacterium]
MNEFSFSQRHIGLDAAAVEKALNTIGAKSVGDLIQETIPSRIRLKKELDLGEGMKEHEYLAHIRKLAAKNKVYKSYIGLGYYDCITPSPILRNLFENPGWYTAYTPYQAEISQGRLEALLNYQTLVSDLTALPLTNASLLDEATAAAEAMIMFFNMRTKEQTAEGHNVFGVDAGCFPQTIDLLKTRSIPLGIALEIRPVEELAQIDKAFGVIIQYPDRSGKISDHRGLVQSLKERQIKTAIAADLMSLALLTPPGEWGADVALGSTQRFGVPMGYGGPHAAYFAATDDFKRNMPGRIIGVSQDAKGNRALRMALQTREQHIKRERATSNICTSQVLLANMASMYAVYHGKEGISNIASTIHDRAVSLAENLAAMGYQPTHAAYFDTIGVNAAEGKIRPIAEKAGINFRYEDGSVFISVDEATELADVQDILKVFAEAAGKGAPAIKAGEGHTSKIPAALQRTSSYLDHSVFNTYRTETELMRYIKKLENKDLSLTHSMIPLGSCTMKLNAASELMPVSMKEFNGLHPFAPLNQTAGYAEMFQGLENALCEITGFAAVSLQPNSGAQGEYAGLMVIRAYHESRGDLQRNVALIPSSAHGTNPASAVMAGMNVVIVKCDEKGNIDLDDLRTKTDKHKNELSCLMVTYPSTHGVFEEGIMDVTSIIHEAGGQVYMDGANMNAQVGLTNPAMIGADVCHLNLHKTFAIPHGGGGPGMGPIGVAAHLAPFLPSHPVVKTGGDKGINAISAAPWGSASIHLISYAYIKMLGASGLKASTETAILNANYIKTRLESHYPVLYQGDKGRVAHEMILDCRNFKRTAQIEVEDIAKRLIDYGFHAPTVSFPVAGTLMIEPTESESLEELDRFCDAMVSIREEIRAIEQGKADSVDNVLKNAPHTVEEIAGDNWAHSYARSQAAFPLPYLKEAKYWPTVKRVDNALGDRNLICTCPPMEAYAEPADAEA